MPYIDQWARADMSGGQGTSARAPKTPGELNYQITQLVIGYGIRSGRSYQTINDIIGALESAKLEFYRRVAVPYEDEKIQENGDVY